MIIGGYNGTVGKFEVVFGIISFVNKVILQAFVCRVRLSTCTIMPFAFGRISFMIVDFSFCLCVNGMIIQTFGGEGGFPFAVLNWTIHFHLRIEIFEIKLLCESWTENLSNCAGVQRIERKNFENENR